MKKTNNTVVYTRVSSAAQSLSLQIEMAKQYMEREHIDINSSIFIEDHNVSATKLSSHERKGLTEVINLIKNKQLNKLVVYKRDRLARNFYEYTDLVKLFIEYDIDVIFTASNEAPFLKNIVFESFHGMIGQTEGMYIKGRTDDARKQFPSNCLGYTRTKLESGVYYTAHPEKSAEIISLFEDASTITSAEMFIQFLIKKKPLKFDRKLKILTNAFYAGYFQKKELFQQLPHVEALISLDTFKRVNQIVDLYLEEFHTAIFNTPPLHYELPNCSICKRKLKLKQINPLDSGFLYCSNKHAKLEISTVEYNKQISLALHTEVANFKTTHLKKIVLNTLIQEKKKLKQELKKLNNAYKNAYLTLTATFSSVEARYDKSLSNLDNLQKSILKIEKETEVIESLIISIKKLINYLISFEIEMNEEILKEIASLLIEEITISRDSLSISFYLTALKNENLPC